MAVHLIETIYGRSVLDKQETALYMHLNMWEHITHALKMTIFAHAGTLYSKENFEIS